MRPLFIILVLFFTCFSCKEKTTVPENTIEGDLDFLIGAWERTNEKEGQNTFEHWDRVSKSKYKGHGYTLKDGDTIFSERMRLFKEDTLWILEVTGPNEAPVAFKLTHRNAHSFIAENPTHDFPTKIAYNYFDDTITARVSGGDMEIPFIFWRVEE